jgi:dolichol-phosphate mannosyltransferase subunit 3
VSEQAVFKKRFRAALCLKVYALQIELPESYRSVVLLVPLWALVSFGLYSLSVVGWSLAYFPTCPQDAATLQQEMKEAQEELCARGILRKDEFSTVKD